MSAETDDSACPSGNTLLEWLRKRAELHADRLALTFLSEQPNGESEAVSMTYSQLWERSTAVGAKLLAELGRHDLPADRAPRALLLFPPGPDFLPTFLGAQLAGYIPVPTCYPKPHRTLPRLNSAAEDCCPKVLLADSATLSTLAVETLPKQCHEIPRLATDALEIDHAGTLDVHELSTQLDGISFLQYTSGSTNRPKGVVVRQRHLMSNLESIRLGFGLPWASHDQPNGDVKTGVFWLPFYHDMGLIGGVLEALYVGCHTVLMSPGAFLRRPIRWLQAIHDYQAFITGAPNFAYQLSVDRIPPDQSDGIDLSHLKIAFCGAEQIAPRTLRDFSNRFESNGFSSERFLPCYGLAEATLLVSVGRAQLEPHALLVDRISLEKGDVVVLDEKKSKKVGRRQKQELVSCGKVAHATEVAIVDPSNQRVLSDGKIGEIWVRGDSVTSGYWETGDERHPSSQTHPGETPFNAVTSEGHDGYCRTGDLGFLLRGELYVTGRLKDLIILRGRNLFPGDIEATVVERIRDHLGKQDQELSEKPNVSGPAAAFSVTGARSEALAIVAELPRRSDGIRLDELTREVRRAVIDTHEVDPQNIWLVRAASIPITTSGKVRRSESKTMFVDQAFPTKHRYDRSSLSEQGPIPFPRLPNQPSESDQPRLVALIESWMGEWLISRAGVEPGELCPKKPLSDYGLDSLTAVELSGETEDWTGVPLTPQVAWDNPSLASLSQYIASTYIRQAGA